MQVKQVDVVTTGTVLADGMKGRFSGMPAKEKVANSMQRRKQWLQRKTQVLTVFLSCYPARFLPPSTLCTQVVFIPLINHLPAELEKIIPCKFNQDLVFTYINWGNKLQNVLLSKVLSTFLNHCNIMVIDFVHQETCPKTSFPSGAHLCPVNLNLSTSN